MTDRPPESRDAEGRSPCSIENRTEPPEIREIERSLALLQRIVVLAREIMAGGSVRSASGAAYDIHRAARSVYWTLESFLDLDPGESGEDPPQP